MKQIIRLFVVGLAATALLAGCKEMSGGTKGSESGTALVGAWKGSVQFRSGAFAPVKDLEFMYAFHQDGTMTESSSYDAAPPVPPAYGVWKEVDAHTFSAHYEFYMTAAPDSAAKGSGVDGWVPSGTGVLTETITLSEDGNSFTSQLTLEAFDKAGKLTDIGGVATGHATRMRP